MSKGSKVFTKGVKANSESEVTTVDSEVVNLKYTKPTTEDDEVKEEIVVDKADETKPEPTTTKSSNWPEFIKAWNSYKKGDKVDFSKFKFSVLVENSEFTEDMFMSLAGFTYKNVNEFISSHSVSNNFLVNRITCSKDFTCIYSLADNKHYKGREEEIEALIQEYYEKPKETAKKKKELLR